ncbi:MAG TPA: tyrosine-type recombinase/integrase [Saprospiraceae bacterium]|nr:tyrosine-type recombinase/integrase [Saprospiraceae bacterium]
MKREIQWFIDNLQSIKRYSPHTLIAYSGDLYQWSEFLQSEWGINQIEHIQFTHLRSFLVHLKSKGISNRAIQRKVSCIRSFYKYLLKYEKAEIDITQKWMALKSKKSLPLYVKEENPDEMIRYYVDFQQYKEVLGWILFRMLYLTGMRRSELLHLTIEDIHWQEHWIRVTGKGNKERRIPVSNTLLEDLRQFLALRKNEVSQSEGNWIFVTGKGKKLYPKYVYNSVHRLLGKITTLEKRSPHILRHTFASQLLNRGADLYAIKELLGHSSLAATQVYTHNSMAKIQAIYKQAHPKALNGK